jgi:molybdopterin synthase sulfur carrier subunit
MIKVVFFASLRERLNISEVRLDYNNQQSVNDVVSSLQASDERYTLLIEQDVLSAVNHTLCSKDEHVKDGDEIAFFPPVTGG